MKQNDNAIFSNRDIRDCNGDNVFIVPERVVQMNFFDYVQKILNLTDYEITLIHDSLMMFPAESREQPETLWQVTAVTLSTTRKARE